MYVYGIHLWTINYFPVKFSKTVPVPIPFQYVMPMPWRLFVIQICLAAAALLRKECSPRWWPVSPHPHPESDPTASAMPSRKDDSSVAACFLENNVADPWYFGAEPDPYLWLTDPAPGPAISPVTFKMATTNAVPLSYGSGSGSSSGSGSCSFCQKGFQCFCLYFLMLHLHHFSKIGKKSHKVVTKQQGFSYYFCYDDRRIRIWSRIHTSY